MIELKLKKMNEKEALKVLTEIFNDWSDNWDLVIDFFGQETADKIDKAVGYNPDE